MRIAFSTDDKNGIDSTISHHFGRCPFYVFIDVENGEVTSIEEVENPYFESHSPGAVPEFIANNKANMIVSGGMGPRAVGFFEGLNVSPIVGVSGKVKDVLKDIIKGEYEKVTTKSYDPNKHDRHKRQGGNCS